MIINDKQSKLFTKDLLYNIKKFNQSREKYSVSFKNEWCKLINRLFKTGLYLDEGKNNKITFFGNAKKYKRKRNCSGLSVRIKGNNNIIKVAKNTVFNKCSISINADDTEIFIDENSTLNFVNIHINGGNNQKISLGKNLVTASVNIHLDEENASLIVKDNCIFSNSISIWATDGHPIFDKNTKHRLNTIKRPVEIGEHCWIGEGVKITKNAKLPPNTIVGIGSVVTKEFCEENTIIAGNPAKVIKRNVIWHSDLNHKFNAENRLID